MFSDSQREYKFCSYIIFSKHEQFMNFYTAIHEENVSHSVGRSQAADMEQIITVT
jgi:hypothetical protein